MKPDLTDITLVVDRSGSMQDIRSDGVDQAGEHILFTTVESRTSSIHRNLRRREVGRELFDHVQQFDIPQASIRYSVN